MRWWALLAVLLGAMSPAVAVADDRLQAAREALWQSHGAQTIWKFTMDRLELTEHDGERSADLDAQLTIGGDIRKFRLETEAHYAAAEHELESLDFDALYSHAIHPFWDATAGLRWDQHADQASGAVGLMGTAPYWVELDATLYVSEHGDVSAEIEAEYELRLTQRFVLQPRVEASVGASRDKDANADKGLRELHAGLRLRYEILPEFGPYLGLEWRGLFGGTADLHPNASDGWSAVIGIRFWM